MIDKDDLEKSKEILESADNCLNISECSNENCCKRVSIKTLKKEFETFKENLTQESVEKLADEIGAESFPKNQLSDFELFKQNFKKIQQSITAEDVRKWNVEYCKRIENESENDF